MGLYELASEDLAALERRGKDVQYANFASDDRVSDVLGRYRHASKYHYTDEVIEEISDLFDFIAKDHLSAAFAVSQGNEGHGKSATRAI
jgi:hypothetical protein